MAGGKFNAGGEVYALRFTFGAFCHYEDLTDKSLAEGLVELQDMGENVRFKPLVPIIQAGLFHSHPNMTPEQVMALDFENIAGVIEAIGEAASAAFPDDEETPSGNARKASKAA